MLRVVIKNSFLSLEVQGHELPRARSSSPTTELRGCTKIGLCELEEKESLDRLTRLANAQPPAPAKREEGPTVDELRQLKCRLEEATRCAPIAKVTSNSSISTMATEHPSDHEDGVQLRLPHVLSSGSVMSLVSDIPEDFIDDRSPEMPFGGFIQDIFSLNANSYVPKLSEGTSFTNAPVLAAGKNNKSGKHGRNSEPKPVSQQTCVPAEQNDGPPQRPPPKDSCHGSVPKNLNLAEEYSKLQARDPQDRPTTMMIRNIPNRYTQREFMRELEDFGFAGSFDFLYVPMDKGTLCNVGYAFVNFVDPIWAEKCINAFDNYNFKKHKKARWKVTSVSVAHIQGLEANIRHYENSAVSGGAQAKSRGPVIRKGALPGP